MNQQQPNELPNIPYFNPYIQAPNAIDPRLQHRAQHQQTMNAYQSQQQQQPIYQRQELLLPQQHWGPANPRAFIPEQLHQQQTQFTRRDAPPPPASMAPRTENTPNERWTPWVTQQQVQSYQAPDWGAMNLPTSTRGHLSEGAPPRSQGPPQAPQIEEQLNPLLQWERPADPRQSAQNQHEQNQNPQNYDITNTWKRAEMTRINTQPHQLSEDAIRLTRGLQTR